MKSLSQMVKIADNVYRASATSKSYYIVVNGVPKFCIQERLDKELRPALPPGMTLEPGMQLQLMPTQERISVREAAPSRWPDPKVQPLSPLFHGRILCRFRAG